jgi:hypothetical protein
LSGRNHLSNKGRDSRTTGKSPGLTYATFSTLRAGLLLCRQIISLGGAAFCNRASIIPQKIPQNHNPVFFPTSLDWTRDRRCTWSKEVCNITALRNTTKRASIRLTLTEETCLSLSVIKSHCATLAITTKPCINPSLRVFCYKVELKIPELLPGPIL